MHYRLIVFFPRGKNLAAKATIHDETGIAVVIDNAPDDEIPSVVRTGN
jgi:hypothetical protein